MKIVLTSAEERIKEDKSILIQKYRSYSIYRRK